MVTLACSTNKEHHIPASSILYEKRGKTYVYPSRSHHYAGIADPHPLTSQVIQQAAATLQDACTRYTEAGYEVQTVRLSTRSVFDDLADRSPAVLLSYVQGLQRMLDDAGLAVCSIWTARVARLDFPLERIELIADLLASTSAINVTVQIATVEHGLRGAAALPSALVMRRLAQETAEGFGNFRFAILACVAAGCPFFPSAYHSGPSSLSPWPAGGWNRC